MKKHLTLDETWKLCLQMWRWIAEQIKKDNSLSSICLKYKWCEKHNYSGLRATCFFCEKANCSSPKHCNCPAKKIDPTFTCYNYEYHYDYNPIAFYKKLVELNKKRNAKRKNK